MRTATSATTVKSRTRPSIGTGLVRYALVLGLVWPPSGLAAEARSGAEVQAENWNRLRSIPREERLRLWENLKAFDALGASERSAIRSLDERIAQLPPSDRANYWSVLRRYHQWMQGLTEAQRNELNAAPPGERMRLVTKLRAEVRTGANGDATPLFLRVIDFRAISPYEAAQRLKAWYEMSPEKRAEIEKIPSRVDQQKRLAELGQHAKGGPATRLTKGDEETLLAKMDANPNLKNWLAFPLKKVADPTKHERLRRRMAVNYQFVEQPPAPVDPDHLIRFASTLPTSCREQFDHLPTDEARRKLSILYRLVFPAPEEMPDIRKVIKPRSAAVAPPRPSSSPPPRPGTPASPKPF